LLLLLAVKERERCTAFIAQNLPQTHAEFPKYQPSSCNRATMDRMVVSNRWRAPSIGGSDEKRMEKLRA